jgi:hypothetical protein
MNLQENIRKVLKEELNEVRVPRRERVELYKDNNIIVVVPLTHRALQKYAHQCQWCINDDIYEWEDYHKGKHAVIIQRNPKKPKIGITGNPTASEIFLLAKWDNNQSSFEDVCQMLDYEFRNDRTMSDYYVTISNDMNNFATNIVYYSPETGIYDQEDNFLWNFNIEINDIPNVKPKVIEIMDDYLQENEEMSLQESIKRTLNEESLRQTLKDQIKDNGILETSRLVGGLGELINLLGKEYFTDDIKIKLIKEIVLTTEEEYITFIDMNENPLVLTDEEGLLTQIEMLTPYEAAVFYYYAYDEEAADEAYIDYDILTSRVLKDIFNMVINYYIKNEM